MLRRLPLLIRGPSPASAPDALRASAGAAVGVAACGLIAHALLDGKLDGLPLLVAPIGASAVLAFALPASPVAQPRAVVLGNLIGAAVGVACAALVGHPTLAAAVAVGAAILVMMLLGCLHPPGGAVALGAVIAGAGLEALPPVAVCSLLMVGAAMVHGRLSGHSYPHRAPVAAPAPLLWPGYAPADLDRALAAFGEQLDVSRDDLDALFREVERHALKRLTADLAISPDVKPAAIPAREPA
jgi:CBS domain-containing membrane protein